MYTGYMRYTYQPNKKIRESKDALGQRIVHTETCESEEAEFWSIYWLDNLDKEWWVGDAHDENSAKRITDRLNGIEKVLEQRIAEEKQSLVHMTEGNAIIQPDWDIHSQRAFIAGVNYALDSIREKPEEILHDDGLNTCDKCGREMDTHDLVWITTEDFTPRKGEVLPEYAYSIYDALCEPCYLRICK